MSRQQMEQDMVGEAGACMDEQQLSCKSKGRFNATMSRLLSKISSIGSYSTRRSKSYLEQIEREKLILAMRNMDLLRDQPTSPNQLPLRSNL